MQVGAVTDPHRFVRNLEERVRELEAQNASSALDTTTQCPITQTESHEAFQVHTDSAIDAHDAANDSLMPEAGMSSNEQPLADHGLQQAQAGSMEQSPTANLHHANGNTQKPPQHVQETLAENLRNVSLAAVAEPYLGSISGLTFAKLTQAVLRRLSPDGRDFVFSPQIDGNAVPIEGATNLHLDFMNDIYFDFDQAIDFSLLAGEGALPTLDGEPQNVITTLPDRGEALRLATFYFDHSHTLYPIIHQQEVMSDIHTILLDPENHISQIPPCMFRVWMVLAIGSTTHSSITLSEESVSRLYYEKAMTYFEASMDHGDIVRGNHGGVRRYLTDVRQVALEAIMLQVSYSFFNQLGPSMTIQGTDE